ncbi:MAG: exonuclease subunit SbcD [Bacteroidales bacterium]|nr:exonuclease subunit SbcD [Bacteroidales bacterium]
MKIIATSDWHLGNLFHGNDRLSEHEHFLKWLLQQLEEHRPEALLVAGDIFDNGNPSAAAQSLYYNFLSQAAMICPTMKIIITAGNHDSASRLEAPRPILSHNNIEIRGNIHRSWVNDEESGHWQIDFDDLIIPINDEVAVIAVPYLRSDIVYNSDYSAGVKHILSELTQRARKLYPTSKLVMMAHMYAKGAEIASKDASEKIVIGGQEEVNIEGWNNHPEYFTCGHIHKRQHIWNTDWARYTGSILPMSFAEKDYKHGVDLISINDKEKIKVQQLVYTPQHRLRILPENDESISVKELKRLISNSLIDRIDGKLGDDFEYLVIKVKQNIINNDEIKELEEIINSKNVVLCKIQKVIEQIEVHTISGSQKITSIDDILNRNPIETLKECFYLMHGSEMTNRQEALLNELIKDVKSEIND